MPILQIPSRRGHVPAGGTIGQVITKLSADNWDYNWANAAGTFLDLTDTPSSYAGQGGKVVSVNVGETGLEFTTAGAGGGVSSFSAGNLSPLFTTSVATATTTPALSFTLSNAAAHTFLGNNTGSTGAPSYVRPAFTDLANLSGTSRLLGAGDSGAAVSEITPGTGIYFSGSTINATSSFTVNVKTAPYNAVGDGVADDTTAIQSAINDVWNAGGGTIFFPRGTYLVNGAFDGTTNSILKIPFNDGTVNACKSITFFGEVSLPWLSPVGSIPTNAVRITTTKTGTGTRPAVLAGAAFNATPTINGLNYTDLYLKDVIFTAPADPSVDVLRLESMAGASLENVMVVTNTPTTVAPTHGTVAIWMPANNNHNLSHCSKTLVGGYATGMKISEQFVGGDVQIGSCGVGLEVTTGTARSKGNFWIGNCPTAILFSGVHYVDFLVNIEHGPGGQWYTAVYDVDDISNVGRGIINYEIVQSGVGPVDGPIIQRNASYIKFNNLHEQGQANAQTASYTPTLNDRGRLILMDGLNLTLTLPNPPVSEQWSFWVKNLNSSDLTISRNGLTINGGAADITLKQHGVIQIWNYSGAYYASTPLVAGTNVTLTPASNGLTIAASGGAGSPGGANTQVQYNDSGAFGGDSGLVWDKTNKILTVTSNSTVNAFVVQGNPTANRNRMVWNNTNGTNKSSEFQWQGSGTALWSLVNDLAQTGTQDLVCFDNVNNRSQLYFSGASIVQLISGEMLGWSTHASQPWNGTVDTAIARSSGGLLEVNNGVAGTLRDLSVRDIGMGGNLKWSSDTGLSRNAAGVLEINSTTPGTFRDLKCDHVNAVTGYRINGAAPSGYDLVGNGTDFISYPADLYNSSTASVSAGYASDTYLAGSTITLNAGDWKAKGQFRCVFDMTKTAAGTATPIITVRMGTLGTTGDAAIATLTFAAGTAAADTGIFDVWVTFRTVGSGTSAVIQAVGRCTHHLAATGLTSTGASGTGIILATSSGFNSTTQTKIGLSFNGGTSFSGTNTFVQAELTQP